MFKVIICGSREFNNYELLKQKCDKILSKKIESGEEVIVVSGAALGADTLGERWAKERGIQVERFPADWKRFGKRAGYLRNMKMAETGNACIAFFGKGSKSAGTKMMVGIAKEKNLLLRVIVEEK